MHASRERLLEFLFPADTDSWLAVLRFGLGFQVTCYSLSLQRDWNYLLWGTARNVAEALLSLESHLVPTLGWLVTLGAHVGLHEETVLRVMWTRFSALSNSGLVFPSLRSQERRVRVIRR